MSEIIGLCSTLITAASPESPSIEIQDQLNWSPGRRGIF
jgi:hypothetical protein